MPRFLCPRMMRRTFLVLLAGAGLGCAEETITAPPIPDNTENTLILDVYRTGADFLDVNEREAEKFIVVGRGGILLMRNPEFERFVTISTGIANDLTSIEITDNQIRIAGMGLTLGAPGIIRYTDFNFSRWTTWDHPALGGITDLYTYSAVTSAGEIMTYDPLSESPNWTVCFEDPAGRSFAGVVALSGLVTAVGGSGRIFRNAVDYDYSAWVNESIADGPDFQDVRWFSAPEDALDHIATAVGGTEIWERIDGNWEMVLDNAGGDLYAINNYHVLTNAISAAGSNGTILEHSESGWSEISVGPDVTFRGVSEFGNLACGDNGAIYYNDFESGWTDLGYSNVSPWNDMDGFSPDEIYAANGDTLMKWDGTDWEPLAALAYSSGIIAIHAVSSDEIWVVSRDESGFDNYVYVWNGSTFSFSNQTSMNPFNSIWCDAAGDTILVAAGNGVVFRKAGLLWEELTADASRRHLYDLDGTSAHDIYAVGQDGLIVHFDGSGWTEMSSGKATLRAIDGPVAVGDDGLVMRRIGASWRVETSGTTADLHAVRYLADDNVWAVGEGSQVIHYDGSEWQVYQRPLMTIDFNTVWGDVSTPKEIWFGGEDGFLLKLEP